MTSYCHAHYCGRLEEFVQHFTRISSWMKAIWLHHQVICLYSLLYVSNIDLYFNLYGANQDKLIVTWFSGLLNQWETYVVIHLIVGGQKSLSNIFKSYPGEVDNLRNIGSKVHNKNERKWAFWERRNIYYAIFGSFCMVHFIYRTYRKMRN